MEGNATRKDASFTILMVSRKNQSSSKSTILLWQITGNKPSDHDGSYSAALRVRSTRVQKSVQQNLGCLPNNNNNISNEDDRYTNLNLNFLELKKQIQELAIQMSQLTTVVNTHSHRGGNQCCPQMGRH